MSLLKNRLKITQSQSPFKVPIPFLLQPAYSQQNFNTCSPRSNPFQLSRNIYQSKNLNIYGSNRKEIRENARMRDLERENRGKSVTERNSLFKRLALKMQQQSRLKSKQQKEVVNEYYQQFQLKENNQNLNNKPTKSHQSPLKHKRNKESSSKKSRYEAKQNLQVSSSSCKVKFNKIGLKKKKSNVQECDLVRISEGQLLSMRDCVRQSLDMRPVI